MNSWGHAGGNDESLEPFKTVVILAKRRVSTMYARGQVAMDQVEMDQDEVVYT